MRWDWIVRASLALALCAGCGDDDGATAGTGGCSGDTAPAGTGGTGGTSGTGGTGGTGATGGEGGTNTEGPWAIPGLPYRVTPTTAIDAPPDDWTFVGFDDSRCANGTPTGIAINPIGNPEGLLVFMQGGGACWDATTCLILKSSANLENDVGEDLVLQQAQELSGLFDHHNVANPFRNYAYVYIPYCTGDLHTGRRESTYDAGMGPVTIAHHGALNLDAFFKRLRATFPNTPRVVVSGISAGGFGATFNWWRWQGAFPHARVDVWDDAGLLVDPSDTRFSTMVTAWDMALPPGCDACDERMSAWLPFYAQHLTAPRRYALSAFLSDAVIGQYFGLSGAVIDTQMRALRAAAAANQKTFFLSGTQHSVVGEGALTMTSDGTSLLPWILQYAADDPLWDHAGP